MKINEAKNSHCVSQKALQCAYILLLIILQFNHTRKGPLIMI